MSSAGATDIFVSRFDALGRLTWGGRFGGVGSDELSSIAVDPSGNAFVAGVQSDDNTLLVVKMGP